MFSNSRKAKKSRTTNFIAFFVIWWFYKEQKKNKGTSIKNVNNDVPTGGLKGGGAIRAETPFVDGSLFDYNGLSEPIKHCPKIKPQKFFITKERYERKFDKNLYAQL
jgi:hypothetical protein